MARNSFTIVFVGIAVQVARPYLARTDELASLPTPCALFRTPAVCRPLGETQRSRFKLALKEFRSVGRQSILAKPKSWLTVRASV